MPATRTQVYFRADQRRLLDEVAAREGVTIAEIVRRALDQYLEDVGGDMSAALEATFGADPEADAPSREEWERG